MRIYKIIDNKIHSLKVKETEKAYIVIGKSTWAFAYGVQFKKNECSISIKEALIVEIKYQTEARQIFLKRIKEINSNLRVIKKKLELIIANDRF